MALALPAPGRLARMALLIALGLVAVCAELAPLGLGPTATPSPDLLFCLIAYFAVRRPGSCPLPLIFGLGLVRDLITDTAVGAGALTLICAGEFLKLRGPGLRTQPFVIEWLVVGGMLAATLIGQWVLVLLVLAQPPYLSDLGRVWLVTMALYPALALVLRWFLRVGWRKVESV